MNAASEGATGTAERFRKADIYLLAPFVVASLDVWLNYFISLYFIKFRVGYIAAAVILVVIAALGFRSVKLRDKWLILFGLMVMSFLLGIASASDIGSQRLFETAGVVIYFLCGYVTFRWVSNTVLVQRVFMILGLLYVPVAVIALMRIFPDILPIQEQFWSQSGVIQSRPEIFTDQNFLPFYLIPVVLGLIMPLSIVRASVFGCLLLGVAYILMQTQTRSGTLMLAGVLLMGLVMAARNPALGRAKALVIPAVCLVLALLALPWIMGKAELLMYRFFDAGYHTGYARLLSISYVLEKIFDITWWIPRGNEEFVAMFDNVPHSNVAAIFLETGIIGLALWIILVPVQAFSLAWKAFFKRLDPVATVVACAGMGAFVLQMSLNVPAHSQVWLWAGCVLGVNERIRYERLRINSLRSAKTGENSFRGGQP